MTWCSSRRPSAWARPTSSPRYCRICDMPGLPAGRGFGLPGVRRGWRSSLATRPGQQVPPRSRGAGTRGEPRARAAAPVRRRQRRARLDAARRRVGPGRAGLAGVGRRPAGRRPDRRPGPAVRHPVGHRGAARPHRAGVARHPDAPGRRDRRRPGRRPRRRRGSRHGGSSPGASPSPATRSPRSAGTGPSASSPRTRPPSRASGCAPRWPAPGPAAWPPPTSGCCSAASSSPAGTARTCYASWEDTVLAFMGPAVGKTTSPRHPVRAVGARTGRRHQQQGRPVGRHRRAARRRRLARVGVRPAAHHRRRAALVVEPAGRA